MAAISATHAEAGAGERMDHPEPAEIGSMDGFHRYGWADTRPARTATLLSRAITREPTLALAVQGPASRRARIGVLRPPARRSALGEQKNHDVVLDVRVAYSGAAPGTHRPGLPAQHRRYVSVLLTTPRPALGGQMDL